MGSLRRLVAGAAGQFLFGGAQQREPVGASGALLARGVGGAVGDPGGADLLGSLVDLRLQLSELLLLRVGEGEGLVGCEVGAGLVDIAETAPGPGTVKVHTPQLFVDAQGLVKHGDRAAWITRLEKGDSREEGLLRSGVDLQGADGLRRDHHRGAQQGQPQEGKPQRRPRAQAATSRSRGTR